MNLDVLLRLPLGSLRSLAVSLESGMLATGLSRVELEAIGGSDLPALLGTLESLGHAGLGPSQAAILVRSVIAARSAVPDPAHLFDLVLSGPDLPGVPTADTPAVIQSLIGEAVREVLLVGYAVHNGKLLFKPLADRMQRVPSLHVAFCLDIARPQHDTSIDSEVVQRFASAFVTKHWPWRPLPEVYYDPRSLATEPARRASMHAKCVLVDRRVALITSANFTEAAFRRNVEAGVLVRHTPMVERLAQYFEGLRAHGHLRACPL